MSVKTGSAAVLYGMALMAGGGASAEVRPEVPVSNERGHTGLRHPAAHAVSDAGGRDEADHSEAAQISRKFAVFAGSGANARSLVTGLNSGGPITLQGDSGANSVTFVPPTGRLRYGNVYIALALTERSLAKAGLTKPNPREIQTALTGGMLTVEEDGFVHAIYLPGVLQLRSRGRDWRGIAQAHGLPASLDASPRDGAIISTGTTELKEPGEIRDGSHGIVLALALCLAWVLPGLASAPRAAAAEGQADARTITVPGKLSSELIDDSLITAKVKAQLLKDPAVSALDVGVDTYKGHVLLSGFVDSPAQVHRAERIASSIRGVQAVHTSLFIK